MGVEHQNQEASEYVQLEGNTNIPTAIGYVSINVNPHQLRAELLQAVDQHYTDRSLRERGRDMSQRVVMVFNNQALIEFLVPKIEDKQKELNDPNSFAHQYLEAERNTTLGRKGQALGSFFLNPVQDQESIFYLNIPLLVKKENLKSPSDLKRKFKHLWVHERHHFVQVAQPGNYSSLIQDQELMFSAWALGMGGFLAGGGVAGNKAASFAGKRIDFFKTSVSRRDFLRLLGATAGTLVGGGGGLAGLGSGIEKLNYMLPFTVEGQAEAAANSNNYSDQEFQRTFEVAVVV